MDNHYHVLVETVDGNLSEGMRHLNGVYTQSHNRRHDRVGHVFQGRYKSILVERESYLLELCRYVVLNPVRGDVVNEPEDFPWSSYRATAGLEKKTPFLTVDWILGQFSDNRHEAQRQYRQFVLAGVKEPSPWEKVKGQCLLGSSKFIEKISPWLEDKSKLSEIPKQQRLVSRPALEGLLGEQIVKSKEGRNKAVVAAHLTYGYSLSEIARHLGFHYTTISKIVKRHL
jgi:hypothetical protein